MILNIFRDISVSKTRQDIGIRLNAWYSVIKISKYDEQFCVVMMAGTNYAVNKFMLVLIIKFCIEFEKENLSLRVKSTLKKLIL
jgi:hypothetical protein